MIGSDLMNYKYNYRSAVDDFEPECHSEIEFQEKDFSSGRGIREINACTKMKQKS